MCCLPNMTPVDLAKLAENKKKKVKETKVNNSLELALGCVMC